MEPVREVADMGVYLNPENKRFQRALQAQIYVDKSGLLAYTNSVLDTEKSFLCVSRPRRFGKSVTAAMLAAYYGKNSDSSALFDKLKISEYPDYKKHLNKYHVLHLDISEFLPQVDRLSEFLPFLQKSVIRELREAFPDCIADDVSKLQTALIQIYQAYQAPFVIIIDEWDAIFREDKMAEAIQKEYLSFLRGMFKSTSSKDYIKLAYLTGILPIKKYGTESALNNFKEFTMLHPGPLAEYIGFTEQEVQRLCIQYKMDFLLAKQWYDGYFFQKSLHIYNPNSIVESLMDGEFSDYWAKTETYEALRNYISANFDGLKDSIIQMLGGRPCKINPQRFQNDMVSFHSRDDILTLLTHLGYLSYNSSAQEVFIPNEEVRSEFVTAIEDAGWDGVVRAISESEELLKATLCGDEKAVAERIGKVHLENTSVLTYNDENSLACVITLAFYYARKEYTLIREFPTGKGFADMVFLPRQNSDKPAIVVELKWDKNAEGAIKQIEEKKYAQALKDYNGSIILAGINYDKKEKIYTCRIKKQ